MTAGRAATAAAVRLHFAIGVLRALGAIGAIVAMGLLCAPADAMAAAAPDSAVAVGVHPLGTGGRDLSLVWESLTVSCGTAGCDVKRRYRIRCRGRGGTYRLATAVVGAGGSAARFDSLTALAWNETPLEYFEEPGRIEFDVPVGRSEVGEIDLQYFVPAEGEAALRFGVGHVALYGEAFWAEGRIPRIDVRFESIGPGAYPVEKLLLEEPHHARGRLERTEAGAALVWSIRNYRPEDDGGAPERLLALPGAPR